MTKNLKEVAEKFRDLPTDVQVLVRSIAVAAVINRMQSQETVARVFGITQASVSTWIKAHNEGKLSKKRGKKMSKLAVATGKMRSAKPPIHTSHKSGSALAGKKSKSKHKM